MAKFLFPCFVYSICRYEVQILALHDEHDHLVFTYWLEIRPLNFFGVHALTNTFGNTISSVIGKIHKFGHLFASWKFGAILYVIQHD